MTLKLTLPGLIMTLMMMVKEGDMVWHYPYDLLMTDNYIITNPDYSYEVNSLGECRRTCVSAVACAAYSYTPHPQKSWLWQCFFSNTTEVQRSLEYQPNATTYFKERKPKKYVVTNATYAQPNVTTFWEACGKMGALPGLILSYQDWQNVPFPATGYLYIPLMRSTYGVRRWMNHSHFLDDDGPLPYVTNGYYYTVHVITSTRQIHGTDPGYPYKILCFMY
ncbi:uncharacterized protein LOC108665348 [Hyalella azteca]|uniref:Uncharacterized protein LOC108665348 n=1 Tax=Hyalella azteca TaxID=294128 RepID=A0A8B7N170_HYAAZ|nr:uncharacterized protein LOC108665348 [Hyalella azteca]